MTRCRNSQLFLLLTGVSLALSSCRITGRQVDATWLTDALTPPENDAVQVEAGRGVAPALPPSSQASRTSQAGTPVSAKGENRYLVRKGDTLFSIARQQGVSPSALMASNHLTPQSIIRPGQALLLPHRGSTLRTAGNNVPTSSVYIVRPGDTLSGIAARHGISRDALLKANHIAPAQAGKLRVGQKLLLPSPHR